MPPLLRAWWSKALVVAVLLGVPGAYLLARDPETADAALVATAKRGDFKVVVTTTGELRARKFVQITGRRTRSRPTPTR